MIATSKHNKYVSIPDWFGSSSNESTTSETAVGTTTVVISGSGNTGGISGGGGESTEIPIDNRTIVWSNSLLTVPIDDDKIIVKDGKITTSTTSGLWELREASDGSSYIYTAYPVATQQGITMYVDNNDLDLPSIYDGLPIDNVTIYWALDDNGNKVLKSIGQSGGGGVADSVAWVNVTGKPSWLLDGKVQYTEIEGTPDLSGFITKTYVDDNFVTFNLDEEISGIKTFTNGLKIGNSSINQSQEDVIYVDANLVVRGGVTIYADTGDIDIPSLIDSLPIAGYDTVEARGIASFDSSYFSVTNGIVTLIPDNVGLNETELVEYLTNNNYAKKSDIPSLSGYATQSWVDGNFVTLTTQQTISGEKNFTGGLKVNGSPIVYDADNKYWKLEGDLLVTGGVTMYANEGTYTPSTIMDAIAVDGTTISKDGGVLKVIGSVGGASTMGSLTNVGSWADSVASQDRIMYQAANSSQWVAKNLSDLSVEGVTGDYLPLSGGIISNTAYAPLTIHRDNGPYGTSIKFTNVDDGVIGYIGVRGSGNEDYPLNPIFENASGTYKIWHSGNDGNGSGLDADLLDGKHYSDIINGNVASATKLQTARTIWGQSFNGTGNINGSLHLSKNNPIMVIADNGVSYSILNLDDSNNLTIGYGTAGVGYSTYIDGNNIFIRSGTSRTTSIYINPSGNVGVGTTNPAYKLETIGLIASTTTTDGVDVGLDANGTSYRLFFGVGSGDVNRGIYDKNNASWWIYRDGTTNTLIPQGAIGLGTTSPKGQLHIIQSAWDNGIVIDRTITGGGSAISVYSNGTYIGNFGINGAQKFEVNKISSGTASVMMSVDSSGNGLFVGGVTMYSDKRKKTILNHVELSLRQIANAPLIEHYYNSDEKKTTHVGSIAQYWANINDWFCKKDSEGFYTMEIQNAALASAISVARELVKFETETDRRIRLLEEENEQLKKEIEILKWNIA